MSRYITIPVLTLALFYVPHTLLAQSIWVPPTLNRSIVTELIKPAFSGISNTTFATSAQILTLRYGSPEAPQRPVMVVELPFAHGGIKSSPFSSFSGISGNVIGNPYIGAEIGNQEVGMLWETGLRIPLHKESSNTFGLSSSVGLLSAFDRFEAYIPEQASLHIMFNHRYKFSSGLTLRLRTGPIASIPTGSTGEVEIVQGYSAQLWHIGRYITFGGGISGRAILSESRLSLAERMVDQMGFTVARSGGRIRPSGHIRFPLDSELSREIDAVYGIQVSIMLD